MTVLIKHIWLFGCLLLLTGGAHAADNRQVDRIAKARLVLEQVQNGYAHVGLEIELADGWHTYWRAPGDAGLPPQFDWSKSHGVDTGNLKVSWPWPQEFQDFDYQTFGYENHVILPIKVPLTDERAEISLKLSYAVCAEVCIPLNANLALVVDAATPKTDLTVWHENVPDTAPDVSAHAHYDGAVLRIAVPSGQGGAMLADTEDGRIFYAPALDEDGLASFVFKPSALNPDPTGQSIRVAVKGADGSNAVEMQAIVSDQPIQDPPKQDPPKLDPLKQGPK